MIRDPASFQILLDTIARLVRENLIPREREVTDVDEIPTDIEAEQALIATNRELIARFEKKIQATLARVSGEEVPAATVDRVAESAAVPEVMSL